MKAQFFVFTIGFFVPFFLQLFLFTEKEDSDMVKILNVVCLFTQVLFMSVELFQIVKQGSYYFYDFWNVVDIFLFFTYLAYFFGRMFKSFVSVLPIGHRVMASKSVPENGVNDIGCEIDKNDMAIEYQFLWIIINSTLLLNSVLSMLFFVRVYERFGLLVTLIGQVFRDMGKFLIFFLSWCIVFSWLLRVAGVDIKDEDNAYKDINPFLYYIIQAFRDASGDFVTPSYTLWSDKNEKE